MKTDIFGQLKEELIELKRYLNELHETREPLTLAISAHDGKINKVSDKIQIINRFLDLYNQGDKNG